MAENQTDRNRRNETEEEHRNRELGRNDVSGTAPAKGVGSSLQSGGVKPGGGPGRSAGSVGTGGGSTGPGGGTAGNSPTGKR